MKELEEYRQKLLHRLHDATSEFRLACLAVPSGNEAVEPGGWSVHQIAVHTRDVDKLVYGGRARRTLMEDNPVFANFDGDDYMAEHYDPREALPAVLDGLEANVSDLLRLLRNMPPEGWSQPSRHATQGSGITLQAWIERDLGHIEEHLATVKRASTRAR